MVVPSLITPIQLDTRPARAPLGSEMVQDYQLVQARELVLSMAHPSGWEDIKYTFPPPVQSESRSGLAARTTYRRLT